MTVVPEACLTALMSSRLMSAKRDGPVPGDGAVERRARRGERRGHRGPLAGAADGLREQLDGRREQPRPRERLGQVVHARPAEQLELDAGPAELPVAAHRQRRRRPARGCTGGEIRLDPETPSTVAWCIFENTAILSSVVALDHPHLPQRAGAVERQAGEVPGQLDQLVVPAGLRQREPVHVPVDVEVLVLDPDRVVELERDLAQLARERGHVVHPGVDLVAEGVERVRLRHRARIQHDQPAHVHELLGGLQVQEARIEPRQAVHRHILGTGRTCSRIQRARHRGSDG